MLGITNVTPSKHQGSKRGYKHAKANPSVVNVLIEAVNENDGSATRHHIRQYKHGRGYGKKIMSNHDRVTAGRIMKDLRKG